MERWHLRYLTPMNRLLIHYSQYSHTCIIKCTHFYIFFQNSNATIDLDDLFNDIYYMDLPQMEPEPVGVPSISLPATGGIGMDMDISFGLAAPAPVPAQESGQGAAAGTSAAVGEKRSAERAQLTSGLNNHDDDDDDENKDLTEQQKLERRERNREHAKRSRLRKKFLLESLQEEIHGLEEQLSAFKKALKQEVPDKAAQIITNICGDKDKFTPLPMPSGFGPVKTLMEPDFRLMSALSGSQQNFAISDPTLPDNPIVYVSQGFLDLTGYTLDQVLGRNCRFLQGPGTDQAAVEVIRKGITEGVDTSVCLLNYRADGTPFWNQFFVAALRDAENNVVNFVGVQCEVSKAVVEKHMGEQKPKAT
jgi:PAS domain S-box-containing protein